MPSNNFSRPQLRELASWIRDTLDPVIAREGPDIMHPDDVLTLQDVFLRLQGSHCITANDLRATGIHKAIMDVAGKATRWPGRLADECDKIIALWIGEFGPLEELRPFLYGRGGRLEGIATIHDVTRADLLKKWKNMRPEMISPKRSHQHGALGFKPGDWWLNGLFAFRDGIIDLPTSDGGICHDEDGAYAILLTDTDEFDADTTGTKLTYRCHRRDPGRFRLSSADFRSRYPIRLLRSHSLSSLWAPKAGVRYEGLYKITGWVIRSAQRTDTPASDLRVSNIIYEVKLERDDKSPIEEVLMRPNAAELDDYAEYKRLRRVQREASTMKNLSGAPPIAMKPIPSHITLQTDVSKPPTKNAPPIRPSAAIATAAGVPESSHSSTGKPQSPTKPPHDSPAAFTTAGDAIPYVLTKSALAIPAVSRTLTKARPRKSSESGRPPSTIACIAEAASNSFSPPMKPGDRQVGNTRKLSIGNGDERDEETHSQGSSLKEIAPWMEPSLELEEGTVHGPVASRLTRTISKGKGVAKERVPAKERKGKLRKHSRSPDMEPARPPTVNQGIPKESRKVGDKHGHTQGGDQHKAQTVAPKRSVTPVARSKNPLGKLFDGAASYGDTTDETLLPIPTRTDLPFPVVGEDGLPEEPATPRRQRAHTMESSESERPLSPVPIRPLSPLLSPDPRNRRGPIYGFTPLSSVIQPVTDEEWKRQMDAEVHSRAPTKLLEDPFVDKSTRERSLDSTSERHHREGSSIPVSLKEYMGREGSLELDRFVFGTEEMRERADEARAASEAEKYAGEEKETMVFHDPFKAKSGYFDIGGRKGNSQGKRCAGLGNAKGDSLDSVELLSPGQTEGRPWQTGRRGRGE